jgi:hypothetical protein
LIDPNAEDIYPGGGTIFVGSTFVDLYYAGIGKMSIMYLRELPLLETTCGDDTTTN